MKFTTTIDDDQFVIDESDLLALEALSTFHSNVFQGFGGELGKLEEDCRYYYGNLVETYLKLLVESTKSDREWRESIYKKEHGEV